MRRKKIIDGKMMSCDFINKREDRFKELLKKNSIHATLF